MSVAAQYLPRRVRKMCIKSAQQFLLHNVSWRSYLLFGEALGERSLRATYDRGRLELMMPTREHERIKTIWGRLVEVLAEEFNLETAAAGSMTHKREDLQRGIEADQCYHIRSWPLIIGKGELDLNVDPPADLALEVDVTSLSISRLPIYAAFRIPEVWRFDGETIHVLLLNDKGDHEESDASPTFPGVPISGLVPFLLMWNTDDDVTIVRAFRAWLRQQLARSKKKRPPRRRKESQD